MTRQRKRWIALATALTAGLISLVFRLPVTASLPAPPPARPAAHTPLVPTQSDVGWRARIEPALLKQMMAGPADERWPAIVVMREQASGITQISEIDGSLTETARRAMLVEVLRATAEQSQRDVRDWLAGEQVAGRVEAVRPYWIFNGLALRAAPQTIYALAARDDVELVRLDHYRQYVSDGFQLPASNFQVGSPREAPLLPTPYFLLPTSYSLLPAQRPEWGLQRIRAPEVWSAFNISGTGVVVANMDTGVYWDHPALKANYRGYLGRNLGPRHSGNWFDATDAATLQPYDGNGHGTHTLGTLVGQEGIGVAPGARWIAVRVLDHRGYGYDSWIHAGFEWILAPGGDPALAPGVLSNSWGNPDGELTTFQADLARLRRAGIVVVFSAGNEGPAIGSVGSPASLPGALAVGATDSDDEVAAFSGRGPSAWEQIKPQLVAPGVNVRSSLPGGIYGLGDGTSMAVPHVAGVAALMLAADPSLSVTATEYVLTSTAAPLGSTLPNNDSGWGLVDAYAAVQAVANAGTLEGAVLDAASHLPLAGATVSLYHHDSGRRSSTQTGAGGRYRLGVAAGPYRVTADAFGYLPDTAERVFVLAGETTQHDLLPMRLSTGVLSGVLTDTVTGRPVTASISLLNTPISHTAHGEYLFKLPVGEYTLHASSLGYRVVTANVVISAGLETQLDIGFLPAPRILLVNSGAWYYREYPDYFRQALDALEYTYDEWRIKHLPSDVPTIADLRTYDVVIWSSPEDSPGYIGADHVIEEFLSGGGMLVLSGQDVAYWDGGGTIAVYASYLRDYLKTSYVRDDSGVRAISGLQAGLMAGLSFDIEGGDGADNQTWPDEIAVSDADHATQIMAYAGDGSAGQTAELCLPYRAVMLPFGYEAIGDPASRRELMRRALEFFTGPRQAEGLSLAGVSATTQVGLPATSVTFTVRLRNTGETGLPMSYTIALQSAAWTASLSPTHLALSPCASSLVTGQVNIPPGLGLNARNALTVTAQALDSPALAQTMTLVAKTPSPVLLVDDDRWYNVEGAYLGAFDRLGISPDVWRVAWSGESGALNGPPAERLRWYPLVVWFTGYDWYLPLTAYDEMQLAAYLDGGGRLMLSSAFYLDLRGSSSFARQRLGVVDYIYGVTATLAYGSPGHPLGAGFESTRLVDPFPRASMFTLDYVLAPSAQAETAWRGDHHRALAIARSRASNRLVFWGIPFEALPDGTRAQALQRTLGWLGPLGDSSVQVDPPVISAGQLATASLVLANNLTDTPAAFTATLPSGVLPVLPTLPPGVTYQAFLNALTWSGETRVGRAITFSFQLVAILSQTGQVRGSVVFHDQVLGLDFDQPLDLRIAAPSLRTSLIEPPRARALQATTVTLQITNSGPITASAAVTSLAPLYVPVVWDSATVQGPGAAWTWPGGAGWQGELAAGQAATLSYQITAPFAINPFDLPVEMLAWDGAGGAWEWREWMEVWQVNVYLPLVLKKA
ncbi:MAG: S8 family serine peptidase [Thermoflexales bacterium]|nr:S8 family serine peptidase [Thermoflexales bacterium]